MKLPAVLVLMYLFWPSYVAARTISEERLVGAWISDPSTIEQCPSPTSSPTCLSLSINSLNEVSLIRVLSDGYQEVLESQKSDRLDELYIWHFVNDYGTLKLILGGWDTADKRRLFGFLYLTNPDNGLYNGWAVSLIHLSDPETEMMLNHSQ